MTIAELVAEWRRLQKWDDNDEFGQHGECRYDRLSEIEGVLTHRRAKSADDLLQTWSVLEQRECTDNEYHKTIVDAFEWEGRATGLNGWSVRAAFEHGSTQDLLRSIL